MAIDAYVIAKYEDSVKHRLMPVQLLGKTGLTRASAVKDVDETLGGFAPVPAQAGSSFSLLPGLSLHFWHISNAYLLEE